MLMSGSCLVIEFGPSDGPRFGFLLVQISHLKLEREKLRCAAFEAQNGVRQRMSRAGSATRLPAQQVTAR